MEHNSIYFSIYFPISNKKVLGFGLQPVFRINDLQVLDKRYSFIGSDKSVTNKPIAYKNNYSINGGISQAFLVYSWQLNPKFSFGIKYSLLFGNQIISDELYTYDVLIDTSNSNHSQWRTTQVDKRVGASASSLSVGSINFIWEFSQNPKSAEVYNLGGGKDNACSLLEAFEKAENVTGKAMNYVYSDNNREGDHICYYSDLAKMKSHYPNWGITKNLEDIFEEIATSWDERSN